MLCLCTTCKPGTHRNHKRASDPLELKYEWLWTMIWVLGTEPGSPARVTRALNRWAISSTPYYVWFLKKISEHKKKKLVITKMFNKSILTLILLGSKRVGGAQLMSFLLVILVAISEARVELFHDRSSCTGLPPSQCSRGQKPRPSANFIKICVWKKFNLGFVQIRLT